MNKKALKSQREFNLFSIENGLGNIDGFVGLGKILPHSVIEGSKQFV